MSKMTKKSLRRRDLEELQKELTAVRRDLKMALTYGERYSVDIAFWQRQIFRATESLLEVIDNIETMNKQ